MSAAPYIAYLAPQLRTDGLLLATRVYNFEDPHCPPALDTTTRKAVAEPRVMYFIVTPAELRAMTTGGL